MLAAVSMSLRRSRRYLFTLIPLFLFHLSQIGLLHFGYKRCAHLSWTRGHCDSSCFKGGDLGSCCALATTDDSSSMSHPPARGSGHASDEADHWLGVGARVVFLQVLSSLLLGLSSDLTNHDDSLGLVVVDEALKAVDEVGAVEGITADANTEGLARHDADLARARCDDAWAVRPNQPGLALPQEGVLDLDHVLLGDSLGDAHDQRHFRLQCLHDGCCCSRRGHIDHSCIRLHSLHSLLHSVEHWQVEVHGASLASSYSSHHVRAIFDSLLRVECSLFACESLADNFALLGEQHVWSSLSVAAPDSIFAASGEVPGQGSDGGGHSVGLARWTHTLDVSAGTKKRKIQRSRPH